MILDNFIDIYTKTQTSIAANGMPQFSKTLTATVSASIQPLSFNEFKLGLWGATDLTSNNKKIFADSGNLFDLAIVQDKDTLKWYEIRNVQSWPGHDEGLLYPLQGGQVI